MSGHRRHGVNNRPKRRSENRQPRMKPSLRKAFDSAELALAETPSVGRRLQSLRLSKDDIEAMIARSEDAAFVEEVIATVLEGAVTRASTDEDFSAFIEPLAEFLAELGEENASGPAHTAFLSLLHATGVGGMLEGFVLGALYALEVANRQPERPRR